MLSLPAVVPQYGPRRVTNEQRSRTVINRHILDLNNRPETASINKSASKSFTSRHTNVGAKSKTFEHEGYDKFNETHKKFGANLTVQNLDGYMYTEKRPYICDNCFQTYFTFQGANICNKFSKSDQVDIIILITSAHAHVLQRMALRTTWLTRTKQNTAKVRYLFILGHNEKYMKQIAKENEKFQDIITANFTDSYENLTLKTIAGFKWIKQRCPQAQVVMKTDDDMFVNVEALIYFSAKYSKYLSDHLFGACWVRKPIRSPKSKYFVSNLTYPNETYPKTCSGTAYVTSSKVIGKILDISSNVPFFHLEDVYVAFCLHQLGISSRRHQGFLSGSLRKHTSPCVYRAKTVISAHIHSPTKIVQIWKFKCPKFR
ncbi:hypothetical protein ACF0H5_006796 [Mactra antiquata]